MSPTILLFRGRGLISSLIRWQTRSVYSHAALLLDDGETILEAWQGVGVRKKRIRTWENVDRFRVTVPVDWDKAIAYAHAQLGKRYDYVGVLRFVSRSRGKADDKLFCSEYIFDLVVAGGVYLLRTAESWRVSPAWLGFSPLLEPVKLFRSTDIAGA